LLTTQFNYLGQIQYIILITCTKLSALCMYLRISQNTKYRIFIWFTVVVVALWGISLLFATVFECSPVHLYWTSVDGNGCSDEDTRLMVGTIINIFTDIQVVLMPTPIILKLALPSRDKVVLALLMCLGIFATIASIVRTVLMADALTVYRYDVTWMGYEVWIWLTVECNLAIICISVPVLRKLVRMYVPCLSMTKSSKGLTSFTSGSIFRRTSVTVECSEAKVAHLEESRPCVDEEYGQEAKWTGRVQISERDSLGHQNSRMDDAYYQHHNHFIGKAI